MKDLQERQVQRTMRWVTASTTEPVHSKEIARGLQMALSYAPLQEMRELFVEWNDRVEAARRMDEPDLRSMWEDCIEYVATLWMLREQEAE